MASYSKNNQQSSKVPSQNMRSCCAAAYVAADGLKLLEAVAEGGDLSGAHKGEVQRAAGSLQESVQATGCRKQVAGKLQGQQAGVAAMHCLAVRQPLLAGAHLGATAPLPIQSAPDRLILLKTSCI